MKKTILALLFLISGSCLGVSKWPSSLPFYEYSWGPSLDNSDFESLETPQLFNTRGEPLTEIILGDSIVVKCCLVKRGNPNVKAYCFGLCLMDKPEADFTYFTDSLHMRDFEVGDTVRWIYIDTREVMLPQHAYPVRYASSPTFTPRVVYHPQVNPEYWRYSGEAAKIPSRYPFECLGHETSCTPATYSLDYTFRNNADQKACFMIQPRIAIFANGGLEMPICNYLFEPHETRTIHIQNGDYHNQGEPVNNRIAPDYLRPIGTSYTCTTGGIVPESLFAVESMPTRAGDVLCITDGEPFDEWPDEDVKEVRYTRTFNNTKWQPFYMPYTVIPYYTYLGPTQNFEFARLNDVHQYDDDNDGVFDRTLVEILRLPYNCKLQPNTPYLIRAMKTGTYTFIMPFPSIDTPESRAFDCSSFSRLYTFTGTYDYVTNMATKGYYALSNGTLLPAEDDKVRLKPFRWYMEISARNGLSAHAPQVDVVIAGEETPTGIRQYAVPERSTAVFDINGIQRQNTARGIYISNGKKYLY